MFAKARLLIPVLLLALAAAACGSDSDSGGGGVSGQSASELLSSAKSQLVHENAVRIQGAVRDKGSRVKLNMVYAGKTASGTVALNGSQIRLLRAKGRSYFKGSDAFYKQVAGANVEQFKQVVNGRWILIDEKSKDFAALGDILDRRTFFKGFTTQLQGTFAKGKQGRISGIDCISLRDSSGTLWLDADDGKLVRLATGEGQMLNFSYDHIRPAKAPKSQDVFDLASLS